MGKVYVITGSTSGIGQALVNEFSKDENNIVFAGYRDETKLPKKYSQNVKYFYINLCDDNSIVNSANFIKSETKHVDTLINVAGAVTAGPIEKIDVNRLRQQFDINTFSHILFSQNLVDVLENSKIINISSMASFGNFPFISPYCASKRALDIFFNAFALENHKNIKVISVKPGVVTTPIWEKSVSSNLEYLDGCKEYECELNFIKNNALKNTTKGLDVKKVVKLIARIDYSKNPKTSYTIGLDAKFAQILSHAPQDLVNCLVKFGLNFKSLSQ